MPTFRPPEPGDGRTDPPPVASAPAGPRPPRRFGRGALVLCGALSAFVGLMFGALGAAALSSGGPSNTGASSGQEQGGSTVLEEAVSTCDLGSHAAASVGDDGRSLSLETRGEEDATGLEYNELVCVLDEVETPDHVINEIESTRALDGRRTAEWEDMSASWNYHPSRGVDLQFVLD